MPPQETPLPAPPEPGAAAAADTPDRRELQRLALGPVRARFRELIGKVGSGERTSTGLSREEAREAIELMLAGGVEEAQLGSFLIAHRIRRPTAVELAGMLEAYRSLGPVLHTPGRRALCFGVPYDGRCRTAPLLPLLALLLAAEGVPVVLHGGAPMPVKYGVTLAELFAALGIDWRELELSAVQERLERCGLALTHQPRHFAAAERLVRIRELIGKRPPLATLELLWSPHRGERLLVSGFVHRPTEGLAWEAARLTGESDLLTVKGLEGSTDLPSSRIAIAARMQGTEMERILLRAEEHGLWAEERGWSGLEAWREEALAALRGEGPLLAPLTWNLGAYLWFVGRQATLPEALERARMLLGSAAGERLRQDLAV